MVDEGKDPAFHAASSDEMAIMAISFIGCFIVVREGMIVEEYHVSSKPMIFFYDGTFFPLREASWIAVAAIISLEQNRPSISGFSLKTLSTRLR